MDICRLTSFLLICLSMLVHCKDSGGCSDNWRQFGSVCYKINMTDLYWKDADKFCLAEGGYLAEPKNRKENENIKKYMMESDINCKSLWFGLSRGTDHKFHFQNSTGPLPFTDWAPDQPDNTYYMENCAEIHQNGWNDKRCYSKTPFICEKDAISSIAMIAVTTTLWTETSSSTSRTSNTDSIFLKASSRAASKDKDILKTTPIVNSNSSRQMFSSLVTPSGTVPDEESMGHRPFLRTTPVLLSMIVIAFKSFT